MRKDLRPVFRFSIWYKLFISVLEYVVLLGFLLTSYDVLVPHVNGEFGAILVSFDAAIDILNSSESLPVFHFLVIGTEKPSNSRPRPLFVNF